MCSLCHSVLIFAHLVLTFRSLVADLFSQHGPNECKGNLIEGCVKELNPTDYWNFVAWWGPLVSSLSLSLSLSRALPPLLFSLWRSAGG